MSINKDLSYAFTSSRQCLRFLGVWPDPHIPVSELCLPNLRYMLAVCLVVLYVFIPQITNVFRVWGNMTLMVECIASVNFSLLALCKLIITWYHGENIMSDLKALRTLMISIKADWMTSKRKWERNTMLKVARTGRSLSFRCYASLILAITFFIFVNLLKFYRNIYQSQRKLVYQFVYPYDIQKIPIYVITYFTQMSAAMCVVMINSTIDTFVSLLLLHICAQLINLRITFNELVGNLSENSISSEFKEGLTAIVLRHENLIRNAKTVDVCYSAVLFIHMMAITFQLCFESFQVYTIIMDKNADASLVKMVFFALYANMLLVNLYMYCYSAEKLITESTSIAYSVYECNWYDLPSKDAKALMLIVYRAMIPLKLTAGKFNTFSIEMFGTLVKTSMGYLSMLLAIKD